MAMQGSNVGAKPVFPLYLVFSHAYLENPGGHALASCSRGHKIARIARKSYRSANCAEQTSIVGF